MEILNEVVSSRREEKPTAQNRRSRKKVSDVMNPKLNSHVTRGSLHSAVQKGNVTAVKILLSRGLSVNATDSLDKTLLHIASSNGNAKMVKTLLQYDAKLDKEDYQALTPIHSAVEAGHLEIFKILVNSGGYEKRSSYINIRNRFNAVPLHVAALNGNLNLIKYIIKNGGEVKVKRCDNKFTPLHSAVYGGHPKCVKELLNHVNIHDMAKYNFLMCIAALGESFISYLRRRLKWKRTRKLSKDKELQYAEISDILLNAKTQFIKDNTIPLKYAIISKHFLIAERILYQCIKFNVNYFSGVRNNLLHLAILYQGPVHFISKLLNAGALVSEISLEGHLPIHDMVVGKNYKILSLLIRAGADINGKSSDGKTIIDFISDYKPKHILSLYKILKYGANIHASGKDGQTGLHTLCIKCFNDCEHLGILLDWFLDFNVVNIQKETPLQYAMNFDLSRKHMECIIKAMVKVESRQTFKISERNMDTIFYSEYLSFFQDCVIELEHLKINKVSGHISFYNLIDQPLETLKGYTRNFDFMDVFNSGVCDSFPIYGDLMISRVCFANSLRKLDEQSVKTLNQLISQIQLPDIVAYKILSFLNVDELEKLSLM